MHVLFFAFNCLNARVPSASPCLSVRDGLRHIRVWQSPSGIADGGGCSSGLSSAEVSEALRTSCCLQDHVESLCLADADDTFVPSWDVSLGGSEDLGGVDPGTAMDVQGGYRSPQLQPSLPDGTSALGSLVGCFHAVLREGLTSRNPKTRSRASHLLGALHRLGCQPKVRLAPGAGQTVSAVFNQSLMFF